MKQIREQVKQEDVDVKSKSSHHSQTDAAKGFGGKYGVMKERQDKVVYMCTSHIMHRSSVSLKIKQQCIYFYARRVH